MARKEMNEQIVYRKLKAAGVQFSGKNMTIRSGQLGIKMLGMVDFMQSEHGYKAKFVKED